MNRSEKIEYALHNLTSPKRGHTIWGLLVTLIVSTLVFWIYHGSWMKDPNQHMLGQSTDGLKNYMTSAWHIQRDSNYVHYDGMNYPYGEHVLFTDNQPIVVSWIQWWSKHVRDLRGEAVGMLNIFQFLSLLLGVMALFLLLRKLHLPVWYAGLVSLGMVLLSPQYARFDMHFSLSHTWVFPWLLFLLCRYEERFSRRYQSLSIGFWLFIVAQIHFYYFGLAAFFLILYTFYHFLHHPSWHNIWRRISHLVVMLVLPFMFINIWLHWADYAVDRPATPYGFTTYLGRWQGVFLPYSYFPSFDWIDKRITAIEHVDMETQAYIGLPALIFSLWLLGLWLRKYGYAFYNRFFRPRQLLVYPRLFPKNWNDAAAHRVHRRFLYGILLSSILLLAFSFGIPYTWKGFTWMQDYFGPVRQFRGLGRFTWAFYYIINIILFYVLWNIALRIKGPLAEKYRQVRAVILFFPLGLLYWDAFIFQNHEEPFVGSNEALREVVAATPDHWLNKVDFKTFQALLPLPYYHIGSENVWLDFDGYFFQRVETTALISGVPDMGVNLSRTSLSQTLKSLQFSLEPCEMPKILDELPNNKPIALMVQPDKWAQVQQEQHHLLASAQLVYNTDRMRILSLYPDSLSRYVHQYIGKVNRLVPAKALDNPAVIRNNFDGESAARHVFQGKGALDAQINEQTKLFDGELPETEYVLSFWIYAREDLRLTQQLFVETAGNAAESFPVHKNIKAIVDDWALIEIPLHLNQGNSQTHIYLQNKELNLPFTIDELMIRPSSSTQYGRNSNWVMVNNYWYKL